MTGSVVNLIHATYYYIVGLYVVNQKIGQILCAAPNNPTFGGLVIPYYHQTTRKGYISTY